MNSQDAVAVIVGALSHGGKVLICGNGGSAAQSQHMSAELLGKFEKKRPALPAISLTTDTSILTAIGNDFGFDYVFARQVEGLGKVGDVLVTFSTSGKSRNILAAIAVAKIQGLSVIEAPIDPDLSTAHNQEAQFTWMHDVCREVEKAFAEVTPDF